MHASLFCDGRSLDDSHFAHKPELFERSKRRAGGAGELQSPDGSTLDLSQMSLPELEEKAILATLERTNGNKVEAARSLGITRQTLYNKLKQLEAWPRAVRS